ncbi:hypothetical protein ABKV81_03660 [Enterobacter hormaechei]|uniref:hypothetical protein n=1 Tax=Enterobacter cloacae complex TaxID=354276 RepID=UPI000A7CB93F|nr:MULTISPECIES: hypothetical protein [Enterobacter cloacae complex]MCE1514337.1 hypothetical protein [Enterobacter hormaechei]
MRVKRYEWVACDEHSCHCDVVESAEGDMVDYEDYAALEARCAALAAENALLKKSEPAPFSKLMMEALDIYQAGSDEVPELAMLSAYKKLRDGLKTPDTDAFLAEVRAQGVERLAKAWYAIANEIDPGISISDSSRLKYRQRADDAADFANEIRQEAAQ